MGGRAYCWPALISSPHCSPAHRHSPCHPPIIIVVVVVVVALSLEVEVVVVMMIVVVVAVIVARLWWWWWWMWLWMWLWGVDRRVWEQFSLDLGDMARPECHGYLMPSIAI